VVDGVTLTRDQVEKAKKELDKPEYPLFKGGNIVKDKFGGSGTFLVLADATQKALTANYGYNPADFGLGKRYLWLAALDSGYAFYCPANDVTKVL